MTTPSRLPSNRSSSSSTPTRQRDDSTRRGSHDGSSPRGVPGAPRPQGVRRASGNNPRRSSTSQPAPALVRGIRFYFPPAAAAPDAPSPRARPVTGVLRPVGHVPALPPLFATLMRGALQEPRAQDQQHDRQITDDEMEFMLAGAELFAFLNDEDLDVLGFQPPLPRGAGVRQDRESVMDGGRREATQACIKAIRTRFLQTHACTEVMAHLSLQLDGMVKGTVPVPACLQKMRLGVSELTNACRTFEGPREERDRSACLLANMPYPLGNDATIGFADLVTLVWTAIHKYEARPVPGKDVDLKAKTLADKADMLKRLWEAFAESIEVDCSEEREPDESDEIYRARMQAVSFRACPVGLAERLIGVLEGYYDEVKNITMRPTKPGEEEIPRFTVAELLTEFCRELRVRYGEDPAQDKVAKTYRRALRRAHQQWGEQSNLTASFTRQLCEWLKRDHDFVPPPNIDPLLESAADDAYSDVEDAHPASV